MGQCTFGGQPCLDPLLVARDLREQQARGLMVDLSFVGRANSYRCPIGQEVGRGAILLTRDALASIPFNAAQDLIFSLDSSEITGVPSATQTAPLKNLLMVRASCIAPGLIGDDNAPYLCELADVRHVAGASVIDRAYNLRSGPGSSPGCYLSATLNSGSPWTWDQMVGDIWAAIGVLGAYPSFDPNPDGSPFVPNGTPEGFNFYGGNAWDALGMVLLRLECAFKLDPLTYTTSIVLIGNQDPTAIAALQNLNDQRVWDTDYIESVSGRLPQKVRVLFPKQYTTQDATGGSPYYISDQTDPMAGGDTLLGGDEEGETLSTTGGDDGAFLLTESAESGTYATLHDDMAATYDGSGTLTNAAALTSRAQERASDYFACAKQARLLRSFIGPRNDPGLLTGPQIRATTWRDYGNGYITDVESQPFAEGWPFRPAKPPMDLTRRILSDGSITVHPTGEGDAETLVLSGGGSSVKLYRLTGLPGTQCGYLDGFEQVPMQVGGSGSGSTCWTVTDGQEVDILAPNL